jgi:hypothetical protein
MTIMIDDAGVGDLLFGVVIGAYRSETGEFSYDVVDVKFFQYPMFKRKMYLQETSRVVFEILEKLKIKNEEPIYICSGNIFEQAHRDLKTKYDELVHISKITGTAQHYTETAYLDEVRNLGYEPTSDRDEKRAKSFFHMLNWVRHDAKRIKYAKTGWPRLRRYNLRAYRRSQF